MPFYATILCFFVPVAAPSMILTGILAKMGSPSTIGAFLPHEDSTSSLSFKMHNFHYVYSLDSKMLTATSQLRSPSASVTHCQ